MSRRLPLLSLILSALLALTSVTMATARGQVATGHAVVICSGYGVVTIVLDARGEPVGTVHPCPDCVLHGGMAPPPPVVVVLRPGTRAEPLRAVSHRLSAAAAGVEPCARAPPVV